MIAKKLDFRKRIIASSILAAVVFIMGLFAHINPRFPGDLESAQWIQSIGGVCLNTLAEGVSFIFDGWISFLAAVCIGILVIWKIGILEGLFVPLACLVTGLNYILKVLIDRPRPSPDLVNVLADFSNNSFPSGHAFYSMIVFGITGYFVLIKVRNKILKILVIVLLGFLGLFVGFSRIYLGAHWPSDVIGGYFAGGLFLFILIWLYDWIKIKYTL
jgi:membrane-associated phospholipid phosphatase